MQLEGIDHVALGVRDIERSVKWYIEVLGFERLHEGMWKGVPTFIGKRKYRDCAVPRELRRKTDSLNSPRRPNASPRFSLEPGKFSHRTARTGKPRN